MNNFVAKVPVLLLAINKLLKWLNCLCVVFFIFMYGLLSTLLVAQTVQRRMIGCLISNKLESILKQAVMT